MSGLADSRNRRAIVGSTVGGVLLFLIAWLWLGWSPLVAWIVGWSLSAFAVYGVDKWEARRGGWRVPEVVLHALAVVGGFPGAWAGRLVFRHKTQKPVFLVVLVAATVAWVVAVVWWVAFR